MLTSELTKSACGHLEEGVRRISTCVGMLPPDEFWRDPSANLVSIGNLILHLRGNVSQYVLRGLRGAEYVRDRDLEFTAKPGTTATAAVRELANTISEACRVIAGLTEEELTRRYEIQGFGLTGVEVVMHVAEHFSYHVGQITFATKLLTNRDTDYYRGRDLNQQ
jgi:uncharacterized damage-inducible protein DinB